MYTKVILICLIRMGVPSIHTFRQSFDAPIGANKSSLSLTRSSNTKFNLGIINIYGFRAITYRRSLDDLEDTTVISCVQEPTRIYIIYTYTINKQTKQLIKEMLTNWKTYKLFARGLSTLMK